MLKFYQLAVCTLWCFSGMQENLSLYLTVKYLWAMVWTQEWYWTQNNECAMWPAVWNVRWLWNQSVSQSARAQHPPQPLHIHIPDASHASSLRAKFASLQLSGNNLSFGFQLPGQAFKLQLLETHTESHLQSPWMALSPLSHFSNIRK